MKKMLAVLAGASMTAFIAWIAYDGWVGSYLDFLEAVCAYLMARITSKLYNQITLE